MSDQIKIDPDSEMEARIVAMILGEASAFETEELERLIAAQPKLALFRDQTIALHGMLHEIGKGEVQSGAEWALPKDKREVLFDVFAGKPVKTSAKSAKPSKRMRDWIIVAIAASIVFGLFSGMLFHGASAPMAGRKFVKTDMAMVEESVPRLSEGEELELRDASAPMSRISDSVPRIVGGGSESATSLKTDLFSTSAGGQVQVAPAAPLVAEKLVLADDLAAISGPQPVAVGDKLSDITIQAKGNIIQQGGGRHTEGLYDSRAKDTEKNLAEIAETEVLKRQSGELAQVKRNFGRTESEKLETGKAVDQLTTLDRKSDLSPGAKRGNVNDWGSGDVSTSKTQSFGLELRKEVENFDESNRGLDRAAGQSNQGGSGENDRMSLFFKGESSGITNKGTLEARNATGQGGDIKIKGDKVINFGDLDVSEEAGKDGGTITFTGDSLVVTDNSKVKVDSAGRAGMVNLKDSDDLKLNGSVDASSQLGKAGSVIVNGTSGGSVGVGGGFKGTASPERQEEAMQLSDTQPSAGANDLSFGAVPITRSEGFEFEEGRKKEQKPTDISDDSEKKLDYTASPRVFAVGGTVGTAEANKPVDLPFLNPFPTKPSEPHSINSGLRSGSRALDNNSIDALIARAKGGLEGQTIASQEEEGENNKPDEGNSYSLYQSSNRGLDRAKSAAARIDGGTSGDQDNALAITENFI